MRYLLALLAILTSLMFYGCGGVSSGDDDSSGALPVGGGGPGGGNPISGSVSVLSATVADGPIQAANVWVASLRRGALTTEPVSTDASGKVSVSIPNSLLMTMADDDILYWYAVATENSKVSVNGVSKDLVANQFRFRSTIGKGLEAKAGANLGSFVPAPETTSVSHFSNAEFVIVETKLGRTESIRPDITTSADLDLFSNALAEVARDIADSSSPVARKFKLIAMATKAIVEDGMTQILEGGKSGLDQSDQILLELGKSSNLSLAPQFVQAIPTLSARVSQDLTSSLFSAGFDPGVTSVIQSISNQSITTAAAVSLPVIRLPTLADVASEDGVDILDMVVPAVSSPISSGGGLRVRSAFNPGSHKSVYIPAN
jgi:hypothetical protein